MHLAEHVSSHLAEAAAMGVAGPALVGDRHGERVHGALGKAIADFVLTYRPSETLAHTPDGVSDEVASTLPVAGRTAVAALDAIELRAGETVLVGGEAGGVGVLVVQLARLAGARVIGTASEGTFGFLRHLGAEPVVHGPGLAERVRTLAPQGVSAATDLFGVEAAEAALVLGMAPQRISTIAAGPNLPGGVRPTGDAANPPDALECITDAVVAGTITVPIAARFPIEQIRDAVALQAGRHVHGKVVVTM